MLIKENHSLTNLIIFLFYYINKYNLGIQYGGKPDYPAILEMMLNMRLYKIYINQSVSNNLNVMLHPGRSYNGRTGAIYIDDKYMGNSISIEVGPLCLNHIGISLRSKKIVPFVREFIGTEYIICPEKSQDYEFMTYEEMEKLMSDFNDNK